MDEVWWTRFMKPASQRQTRVTERRDVDNELSFVLSVPAGIGSRGAVPDLHLISDRLIGSFNVFANGKSTMCRACPLS